MANMDSLKIEFAEAAPSINQEEEEEAVEFDIRRHNILLNAAPEIYVGSAEHKKFLERFEKRGIK